MNTVVNVQLDTSRTEDLIALIDEMIVIVTEENTALAKGLPASRSKQLARKTELAALLEQWVVDVSSKKIDILASKEPLRSRFTERVKLLQTVMDDNVTKLRAAIETSQRRIDAVMAAVRERVSDATPYAANGRMTGHVASYAANIRA